MGYKSNRFPYGMAHETLIPVSGVVMPRVLLRFDMKAAIPTGFQVPIYIFGRVWGQVG